jgi:peptidyl-dipeptidase Dcp
LAETNAFEMHLTDEKTSGLPEGTIEAALPLKQKRKKRRLDFHLRSSKLRPFMTYADNRELRKKLAIAFGARFSKNEFDNQEIVLK